MIQVGLENVLDQLAQEFVTRGDKRGDNIGKVDTGKHTKTGDNYSGLIVEKAQRLIVIDQAIPVAEDFIPFDDYWKKLAEQLGPLDEEMYKLFHDRKR